MSRNDENLLVARARRGDQQAMEQLYQQCAPGVFTLLRRLAGDTALAEDLSQDVWMRAFTKLDQFRGDASFNTWINRLARNRFIDHVRAQRDAVSLDDDTATVPVLSAPSSSPLDRLAIEHCLDLLPPGYRTVLVLHVMEGLSYDEIAEQLGIKAVTCRTQLFKARARLAECLA